jgi:peroxiredoxin
LEIVGIHTQSSKEKVRDFVKQQEIPYRVAVDKAGEGKQSVTIGRYDVDSYPDYYMIDRKGILRFADLSNGDVDKAVEKLLAEE